MDGVVKIHGKDYKTVAYRVQEFREKHPDYGIDTEILSLTDTRIIIRARVIHPDGRIIGSGIAMEEEGSSTINRTSHVEVCETSAIGRALAAAMAGFAGSASYASADEVAGAISGQAVKEATDRLIRHNEALRDNLASVCAIQEALIAGDLSTAAEEWFTLADDVKSALWVAPTKGGIFPTKLRELMKTAEFREAYFGKADN